MNLLRASLGTSSIGVMQNPWLDIPLSDYESHMQAAQVQQLGVLSELFAEALEFCKPQSVAILGIAGGNGLGHIDSQKVKQVVGFDLNPQYLEAVRERYGKLPLELHCLDLAEEKISLPQVDMTHASLVFEHAGAALCLENALSLVPKGGFFSVVLQLPARQDQNVGSTGIPSIQKLASHFALVDPVAFQQKLFQRGFRTERESEKELPGGKSFWAAIFSKTAE